MSGKLEKEYCYLKHLAVRPGFDKYDMSLEMDFIHGEYGQSVVEQVSGIEHQEGAVALK